jgi:hypothetical protein
MLSGTASPSAIWFCLEADLCLAEPPGAWFTCEDTCLDPVVAAPSPQPSGRRHPLSLVQGSLIQRSLSAQKVARRAPLLAGLHRMADGLLLGLGGSMIGLAALTLHWQGAWTDSFQRLEASQLLEHRFNESSAVLEQHHLAMARRPGQLLPTSIQKLIYLPSPASVATQPASTNSRPQPLGPRSSGPLIRPGY